MAIRITALTIVAGAQQRLQVARGEARQFLIGFLEPPDSPMAGQLVDISTATRVRMSIDGLSPVDATISANLAAFTFPATIQPPQTTSASVEMQDATGFKQQLMAASPFVIVEAS